MTQSNYKEELKEIFLRLRYGLNSEINKDTQDALAAIDRLNETAIGEDEATQMVHIRGKNHELIPYKVEKVRNQLRSELRQAFGISAIYTDLPFSKEEEKL